MLHKSFKPAKCKTTLKLAVARIKLLRNKKQEQVRIMRRELAQLLETGQEQTARIRVEHVIREDKTMAAYDLIELYCELIVARLSIIESQKSCPIDLKEAISSVIFASPRCADLPELMDIRKHFAAKYGKDFINSALEVRPDCGVSRLVVEKLSARAPDIETKIKILTAIAQEHNIKWDPKAFEEQHQKAHEDLLNGPNTFASASKTPTESSNLNSSSGLRQTNESSIGAPQNETTSHPTDFSTSSQTNTRTPPDTTRPFTSQSGGRPSDRRSGSAEVKNSNYREQNTPLNQPQWSTEFRDATSAAKAAAESAERASIAARAAADLASRGHMSRQNSTDSDESTTPNKKYERPEKLRGLLGEDIDGLSVTMPYDERTEVQDLHIDERMQETSRREAIIPPGKFSYDYADDNIFSVNLHKDDVTNYSCSQSISSESESVEKAESSHDASTFLNGTFWNSNINKNEDDEGQTITTYTGEGLSGSNRKLSNSGDYSGVVFDDYGSDVEDNISVFGRNTGNLLDSHQEDEPSSFNIGLFNTDQNKRAPVFKNSSAHLFTESNTGEPSETKATFPSHSYNSVPATFDDSDGESIESEEEVANSAHKNAMKPSNSFSDKSVHDSNDLNDTYIREKNEIIATSRSSGSSSSLPNSEPSLIHRKDSINSNDLFKEFNYSSADEEEPQPLYTRKGQPLSNIESKEKPGVVSANLGVGEMEISNDLSNESGEGINFGRLRGGFKHRGFPRPPYVRSSNDDASQLSKQTFGDTSNFRKVSEDTTELEEKITKDVDIPLEPLHLKSHKEVSKEVSSNSPSTYYDPDSKKQSYTVDSGAYRDGVSAQSKRSSYVSPVTDKFTPSYSKKTGASSKMQAYRESDSGMNELVSDVNEENLGSNYTGGSRPNADVKLSRRTRDLPSEAKRSSSKFSGHSKPSLEQPSESPKQTVSTSNERVKLSQLGSTEYIVPTNNSNSGISSSSEVSASHEDSLTKASHTHPKLPDYESLAAHFRSLRSNQQ